MTEMLLSECPYDKCRGPKQASDSLACLIVQPMPCTNVIQPTGRNLGQVFNFRSGHLHAAVFQVSSVKLPNLQLISDNSAKKKLLGSLPLVIALPAQGYLRNNYGRRRIRGTTTFRKMTLGRTTTCETERGGLCCFVECHSASSY